jgi:ribonuclease HI
VIQGNLNVYCDGSITGGPWGKKGEKHLLPHAWSGWVVKRDDGIVVHHHAIDLGEGEEMTGNVAEYMALRSALQWLRKNHPNFTLRIHSDSQLIIRQMLGQYSVGTKLQPFRDNCLALARSFPYVEYVWIRRDENKYADYMSKVLQIEGSIPAVPVQPYVLAEWK